MIDNIVEEKEIGLEKYYKGDQMWVEFVKNYETDWSENKDQLELLKLLNDRKDLAKVIYGLYPDNYFAYLNKSIPALNGLTPLECLYNEKLMKRLKVCLTRSFR